MHLFTYYHILGILDSLCLMQVGTESPILKLSGIGHVKYDFIENEAIFVSI